MSKKRIVFTDTMIKNLRPSSLKYTRSEGNGFTIRVMPTGTKTWHYLYSFDEKRREIHLGTYSDVTLETARRKFENARKLVKNGIDPLTEQEQAAIARKLTPSVADFVDEYIENYAKKHNKSWKEIERALNASIVPNWGKRKITEIKRRDLLLLLDEIEKRAPIMANRTLAYVRKLFSYAVKRDVLEANPFMGMDSPAPAKVRDRNLSFAEIKKLWANLDNAKMNDSIKRALKLILVTGQRPGEVIGMHSSEIDDRWWTVPIERSKNKRAHRVYLTDLALELIGTTKNKGYIFESPSLAKDAEGKATIIRPYEVRTMTSSIKENLPHTPDSKVIDYLQIPHFVPHDLRRTATSRMAEIGIFEDTIDRVQNHVSMIKSGVRKNYNHYAYDKEKQIALETWERKLIATITEEEKPVV